MDFRFDRIKKKKGWKDVTRTSTHRHSSVTIQSDTGRMLGHYLDNSLHVSRFLNTGGGNHRESIIHRIVVRIVRVLATLRRAPIVDNSMVVVRLITVPIPCSDAYVSRSGGSSQIWMIIGRTRLIYEYRNGRCLLDEINLHYTTLSRLVASSIDAGGRASL